jgi:hypothetical protein
MRYSNDKARYCVRVGRGVYTFPRKKIISHSCVLTIQHAQMHIQIQTVLNFLFYMKVTLSRFGD